MNSPVKTTFNALESATREAEEYSMEIKVLKKALMNIYDLREHRDTSNKIADIVLKALGAA